MEIATFSLASASPSPKHRLAAATFFTILLWLMEIKDYFPTPWKYENNFNTGKFRSPRWLAISEAIIYQRNIFSSTKSSNMVGENC